MCIQVPGLHSLQLHLDTNALTLQRLNHFFSSFIMKLYFLMLFTVTAIFWYENRQYNKYFISTVVTDSLVLYHQGPIKGSNMYLYLIPFGKHLNYMEIRVYLYLIENVYLRLIFLGKSVFDPSPDQGISSSSAEYTPMRPCVSSCLWVK